jgi:hypothetical protein
MERLHDSSYFCWHYYLADLSSLLISCFRQGSLVIDQALKNNGTPPEVEAVVVTSEKEVASKVGLMDLVFLAPC